MKAWKLTVALSSSSGAWKEWELRGAVFLSLALQIALICLGNYRKYFPHAWIRVLTWLAYLLADSVAIYGLGMISNTITEIKAGKSLSKMDPHAELSTFWAPFLLLHLGGPDTISAYAIEDNELWLRHLLTLVNQAGLTVYVLIMTWSNPILSFLAILILLSGFYKYGERVWVLRAASNEPSKDSLAKSQPRDRMDSNNIVKECELKEAEGYNIVCHQVINVDNYDAIMIDVAIAEFLSKNPSSRKDSEDQEYKRVVGPLLSASRLVDASQRLFADHVFSMEEGDSCLSILSSEHRPWDFKVIEIELGLIYDVFYSKAKAVYTKLGFVCRLAIFVSICVALVLFSFTDKRPYSKPDLFLTFLLLGAAIFVELFALAHILLSNRAACWLIKKKRWAVFCFINRIKQLSKRCRGSTSMGQYNLMSYKTSYSWWWSFLGLLHIEEMAVQFFYQRHEEVTEEIKELILSKIKKMEAGDAQKLDFDKLIPVDVYLPGFPIDTSDLDGLLRCLKKGSIEQDFDLSILIWHIATELCYYLDYPWTDSIEEPVKKNLLIGLRLSRYMLYLLFMCPSMLPARIGSIRFPDIYEKPSGYFNLPDIRRERKPRDRKPGNSKESETAEAARDTLLGQMGQLADGSASKEEDQVGYVFRKGCQLAMDLQDDLWEKECKWVVIGQVWAKMLIYAAHKCKAREHARHMGGGSELITQVWLLMAHYGLTDHFQKPRGRPATAEIIVKPW
ncbi:hypothetical protein BT93_G1517 [Corymbia citriodora subsp. variegata]|nr:hypothetical protein BT93_G1517 [Corymbia citriodora subsp. variegata]